MVRLVLYGRKEKSHFGGKMVFLPETRKKSYYTEGGKSFYKDNA
jgi:hypothetical protein